MTRRTLPLLTLSMVFACGGGGDDTNQPMFTTASGSGAESGTMGEETSDSSMTTTGPGDGDGSPGDGDGTPGDGDGDNTTTTTGPGDGDGAPGCMTDPNVVGASCGAGSADQGSYGLGQMNTDLPIGMIMDADNGQGSGAEDWYQFDFPIDPNNPRPTGGMATIDFAMNDNNDYRFEVFRDCGAQVYGQGLASEFGASAPPLTEWSFNDLDLGEEQAMYMDNVLWPTTVWVRVFRFQNDGQCTAYQLQVMRN